MIRPYRPSNGTEGEGFFGRFCANCWRDRVYRESDGERGRGCPILARSLAFELEDPRYPKEWVRDDDGARCTAFAPMDEPAPSRGRALKAWTTRKSRRAAGDLFS